VAALFERYQNVYGQGGHHAEGFEESQR
jgi:hypothetical protein